MEEDDDESGGTGGGGDTTAESVRGNASEEEEGERGVIAAPQQDLPQQPQQLGAYGLPLEASEKAAATSSFATDGSDGKSREDDLKTEEEEEEEVDLDSLFQAKANDTRPASAIYVNPWRKSYFQAKSRDPGEEMSDLHPAAAQAAAAATSSASAEADSSSPTASASPPRHDHAAASPSTSTYEKWGQNPNQQGEIAAAADRRQSRQSQGKSNASATTDAAIYVNPLRKTYFQEKTSGSAEESHLHPSTAQAAAAVTSPPSTDADSSSPTSAASPPRHDHAAASLSSATYEKWGHIPNLQGEISAAADRRQSRQSQGKSNASTSTAATDDASYVNPWRKSYFQEKARGSGDESHLKPAAAQVATPSVTTPASTATDASSPSVAASPPSHDHAAAADDDDDGEERDFHVVMAMPAATTTATTTTAYSPSPRPPLPRPPQSQQHERRPEDRDLVEARPVYDDDYYNYSSSILVEARADNHRQVWIYSILVMAAMLIILGVTLGVTLSKNEANQQNADNIGAEFAPTFAPTALPDFVQVVQDFEKRLLDETVQAIQANESSPQSRAYAWATFVDQPPLYGVDPVQRMVQRFALATFFYVTEGDTGWTGLDKDGWLNYSRHECTWYGCTCGSNSSSSNPPDPSKLEQEMIHEVRLQEGRLSGSLPPELALLEHVKVLQFGFNYPGLTGPIPSQLSRLQNLTYLSLTKNDMTGPIPSEIRGLTNLEKLFLASNARMTDTLPTEIGLLTSLQELDLSGSSFSGTIPTEFGALANLIFLDLSRNAEAQKALKVFNGSIPTELWELFNLNYLNLGGNALTGTLPSNLGSALSNLEKFYLDRNALSGRLPTALGELKRLLELDIYKNAFTGSVPTELCDLVDSYDVDLQLDCNEVACDCDCKCRDNVTTARQRLYY